MYLPSGDDDAHWVSHGRNVAQEFRKAGAPTSTLYYLAAGLADQLLDLVVLAPPVGGHEPPAGLEVVLAFRVQER
eukprot:9269714-Ditylum_brightwellii.AAC.1